MSRRAAPVSAPVSPPTRLQHVLKAGLDVSASRLPSEKPGIVVDGVNDDGTPWRVEVSTDPSDWSALTTNQLVKLKLSPVDWGEFNSRGAFSDNPNAAYDRTLFKSNVPGPTSEFKFWVAHLGFRASSDEVGWYVLARPPSDRIVYRRPSANLPQPRSLLPGGAAAAPSREALLNTYGNS